jgi:VanZ family protein
MCDQHPWLESRWTTVALLAATLLAGAVVPSPLGRHPEFGRFGPDKLLHLVGHAWLTAALADALVASRLDEREAAVVAVCASTGYGVATGLVQTRVPGRAFERADVTAGLLGSVLVVLGRRHLPGAGW